MQELFDSRLKGPFVEHEPHNPVQAVALARRAVDLGDKLLLLDDARAQIAQELLAMYADSGNERVCIEALKAGARELRLLRADWLKDADRTRNSNRETDDAELSSEVTSDNAGRVAEALKAGVADAREKILSRLNDRKSASEEDHTISRPPSSQTGGHPLPEEEGLERSLPPEGTASDASRDGAVPPHSRQHRAEPPFPADMKKRPRGSRRLN